METMSYHNNPRPNKPVPRAVMLWVLIWTTEIGARTTQPTLRPMFIRIHSFNHQSLHNYYDYLAFPLTCRHGENMTAFAHIAHFSPMY